MNKDTDFIELNYGDISYAKYPNAEWCKSCGRAAVPEFDQRDDSTRHYNRDTGESFCSVCFPKRNEK